MHEERVENIGVVETMGLCFLGFFESGHKGNARRFKNAETVALWIAIKGIFEHFSEICVSLSYQGQGFVDSL